MKDIQMTPGQMLSYARQQLRRCETESDSWRKVVDGLIGAGANGDENEPSNATGSVTAEKLRAIVSDKAKRVKDLADRFQVRPRDIEDIIEQAGSGLVRGERGWIKASK